MVDSGVSGGEGVRNMAVKMEGFEVVIPWNL